MTEKTFRPSTPNSRNESCRPRFLTVVATHWNRIGCGIILQPDEDTFRCAGVWGSGGATNLPTTNTLF